MSKKGLKQETFEFVSNMQEAAYDMWDQGIVTASDLSETSAQYAIMLDAVQDSRDIAQIAAAFGKLVKDAESEVLKGYRAHLCYHTLYSVCEENGFPYTLTIINTFLEVAGIKLERDEWGQVVGYTSW